MWQHQRVEDDKFIINVDSNHPTVMDVGAATDTTDKTYY